MTPSAKAVAEKIRQAIRAGCGACGGTGIGGTTGGIATVTDEDGGEIHVDTREAYECEYCGRPRACVTDEVVVSAIDAATERLRADNKVLADERDALRLVHQEARELIGEADATGAVPKVNLEALRTLLWRATARTGELARAGGGE